jgi:hypothetical protein
MPYIVVCPKCDTKLKSGQPVPAGRALTCPTCKTNFTLKVPAQEVDAPRPAAPRSAPAVPPPTGKAQRPVASRNDDDDRPRSRPRDDDEDERPRGKRRPADDEVEDQRPKSRKRPDDDEDEDRPKARKRRDDDEEDERPKVRKRRDDDDDEEDRPKARKARDDDDRTRSRGRGGKKKGRKKLVLVLGALAALFLFCAGGGAALYFTDPFGWFGGGSSSSDMLAWVPSEMQAVEGANVDAVAKNTKMMSVIRPDVKDIEAAGIKLEDMSSYVLAKRNGGAATEVFVIKTKSSVDKDKIIKALGGQKVNANGKDYYRTKDNGGLFFPSDKMVVWMKTENMLSNRLASDTGKVVLADDLKAAVKRTDGDLWAAGIGPDAGPFGDMSKGGMPGVVAPPPPKSVIMNAKLLGSGDVSITVEQTYADSDGAKKAQTAIEASFKAFKDLMNLGGGMIKGPEAAKMQEMKKMFDSIKVTQSGSTVTISMTSSPDGLMLKGGGMGK